MNRKHKKAALAAAVLISLAGCSARNLEESSAESSSAPSESAVTSSVSSSSAPSGSVEASSVSNISSSTAPEESGKEEPRPLYVENPAAGYEPFQEESSGLYHVIQPSADIPYEVIDFKKFGQGKVLFEYLDKTFPGMSGNDEYQMGIIAVYDTASRQYITAGDRWESRYTPVGQGIIMKSGYYYSSWTEDNNRCVTKIDLATGKRTTPHIFEKDYGGGIGSWTVKIDETHFLIVFDENMVIYNTETNETQELPAGTFKNIPVCQQDGKLYEITVPESGKRSEGWHLNSYDPASGEAKDYGNVAETRYITPGIPFQKYLSEGETLSMYPFIEKEQLFWIVWKDNVPVRFLGLENQGYNQVWTNRESETVFFQMDNISYLMDVQTGEIRVLDFGYREKYQDMQLYCGGDGSMVLIPNGQGPDVKHGVVYFIPKAAIDKFAVPYGEFAGIK